MKAVQIVKPNQLEVIDIEKPVIDPKNNVLVKMTAAGICGSDVGIYHGIKKIGLFGIAFSGKRVAAKYAEIQLHS
jgi:threonine dehydrogenase-like Zn-dependent dehydrogenase